MTVAACNGEMCDPCQGIRRFPSCPRSVVIAETGRNDLACRPRGRVQSNLKRVAVARLHCCQLAVLRGELCVAVAPRSV